MIAAALAFAFVVAYVAVAVARYRHGYIKRELAFSRGEKSPGWHTAICNGARDRYRYHACWDRCYEPGEGCKGKRPRYERCDCPAPLLWSVCWFAEAPAIALVWAFHAIGRLAKPDVGTVGLDRRQRRIQELERELGIQ